MAKHGNHNLNNHCLQTLIVRYGATYLAEVASSVQSIDRIAAWTLEMRYEGLFPRMRCRRLHSEPDSSVIVKCIRKTLNDVIATMVGPHDFEFLEHMICFKTSERKFRTAILI